MHTTTDTPQNDPGLAAIARWREGMARLRWQISIAETSRGYNPEFIALTCEKYNLNDGDIMLACCQNERNKANERK